MIATATRYGKRVLTIFILVFCACSHSITQVIAPRTSPAPGTSPKIKSLASFDVVSIRPSSKDEASLGTVEITQDEYHAIGEPLWVTIMRAYYPTAFWDERLLVGVPAWVMSDVYTVRGKIAPEDFQAWQKERANWSALAEHSLLEEMLQGALADRCGLVTHRTPGAISGFALIIDKHGVNGKALHEAKSDRKIPGSAIPIAGGAMMIPTRANADGEKGLTFFQTSMTALAAQLSNYGAPVIDQTRLGGQYDFFLRQANEGGDMDGDWDTRLLGLRLIRVSVPMDKVVIDHIDKPTPN